MRASRTRWTAIGGLLTPAVLGALTWAAPDEIKVDALMLRYPDVSDTHIAFVYANNVWLAPKEGGLATPLSSPRGGEQFPRFSPDGQSIAFSAQYDGNQDVYVLPIDGGVATRLTYHPYGDRVIDWMPDGRVIFRSSREVGRGAGEFFVTTTEGGMPEKLPVPYAEFGSVSPDGRWLAYTPYSREFATWKRYQGGLATDVWVFNLETYESRKLTDHPGTDALPMWADDGTVYYLSDAGPEHRLNIWKCDVESGECEQVTEFEDYDVKWPSIGPEEIVFENGGRLYLLSLDDHEHREVEIRVPGDHPTLRSRLVDVSDNLTTMRISSTGKRVVAEARGDVWTLPAEKGSPRNLTRTDGVAERDPSWSPDGKWIAYFCDESGEYELCIRPSDGKGEPRQLTEGSEAFFFDPQWSPDSKMIAFSDKAGRILIHKIEEGETVEVDQNEWGDPMGFEWSPDSRWLTYSKPAPNYYGVIMLYDVENDERHAVTSEMYDDVAPVFDRSGDYLYYVSRRTLDPVYADNDWAFAYVNSSNLVVVPLRGDMKSPFAPESDEETWGDDDKADDDGAGDDDADDDGEEDDAADDVPEEVRAAGAQDEDGDSQDDTSDEGDGADDDESDEEGDEERGEEADEVEPVEIDIEGFEARAVIIPVDAGNFSTLAGGEKKLFYIRQPRTGSDAKPKLCVFELEDNDKREEKTLIEDAHAFMLSADGKKMLVNAQGKWAITDAGSGAKMDKAVNTGGLKALIHPRAEWRQIVTDAWRIHRDYFYDPNMHGVDWEAMKERYVSLVDFAANREDVSYIIGEMISELNASHTYNWGGDTEAAPSENCGMLGCDFELAEDENGNVGYRISKIHRGADWDIDARSPLAEPGVDVKEGDFLIEVNGAPVDTDREPWAAFQGMANQTITIVVNDVAEFTDDAREVLVRTIASEGNLRFRAWIEANRKYVEEQTDGRVGYVYVPDTGVNGQNHLVRQFFGQMHKDALIIDERWNGGGQIPDRFVEILNRPTYNYWARRDGRDWRTPWMSHFGPKCMLINGPSGSGGDAFPAYFRRAGLGKLIGTRTWGGLIGISGNPGLIDGGYTSVPTFGYYDPDGTWGIEGHGVDPDIEVIDDPTKLANGEDPQLDAAIEHILDELRKNPPRHPKKPAYPDRSKAGVPEEEW